MADLAAKREARRQRILQNSESRLLKISGRDTNEIKTNGTAKFQPETESESNSFSHSNLPEFDSFSTQDPCEPLLSMLRQEGPGLTFEPQELDSNASELSNLINNRPTSSPGKQSVLNNFLFNRLIYVPLALLINSLIILEIDNPTGKSIITPFLLLLLPRVYILSTQENSPRENMLYAVLMLCNIRPSLISKLKNSYKIFNLILHDFNVYMFAFVIFYYAITRHFVGYDEELSKLETVKVIIDPST